jgi:hypothetical protein
MFCKSSIFVSIPAIKECNQITEIATCVHVQLSHSGEGRIHHFEGMRERLLSGPLVAVVADKAEDL